MKLTPGSKLRSAASTAQLIVIRSSGEDVELSLAGAPVTSDDPGPVTPADGPPLLVGKRYVNADDTVEVLCASPGNGPLTLDDTDFVEQAAKSLPASD